MAYKIGQVVIQVGQDYITSNEEIIDGAPDAITTIQSTYSIPTFSLSRFGIQARPGSYFRADGEIIKIGRSGTYEIQNELVSIGSLELLSEGTYIIDFKY